MKSSTFLSGVILPTSPRQPEPGSLYAHFAGVSDKRGRRGRRYTLALVLTLVVLAKSAGEHTPAGIAEWVRLRQGWVCQVLDLPYPHLPCANTYVSVCGAADVAELNAALAAYFVPELPPAPATEPLAPAAPAQRGQRHLAVDGKTSRGSDRQGPDGVAALKSVTLYDLTHQGPLAQQAQAPGSDERAVARALIAGKDLRGCVVSADAFHTHTKWCRQVVQQGGDYLLIAKGNQPLLRADVADLFAAPLPAWLGTEHLARSVGKAHGRLEVRALRVTTALAEWLAPTWPGVAQVFQLQRTITKHGRTTQELVYGLTSLPPVAADADRLLALIRHHWFIENGLHWRRDVTLHEDGCQVRAGPAAQVLTLLNTALVALMDHLHVPNMAAKQREFAAHPDRALALLLTAPDF